MTVGTEPTTAPQRAIDRTRRNLVALTAALGLMLVIMLAPAPPPFERAGNVIELSASGQMCLAIMAFAVTLWLTEAMPFAATSLLVLVLIAAFGVADYRTVIRAGFGDPIVTFILGALMLSAAFTRSGLGTRLAYHVLLRVGTRTDRVLLGMLGVGVAISMWIPDVAVAAMLMPVAVGLLRDAGLQPGQSQFGRALMISVAFGPLIGGIATPAGTTANLVAIAQLQQLANIEISFATWMAYGTPPAILMVPFAWWILLRLFPPEIPHLPVTVVEVRQRLAQLGAPSRVERATLVIFLAVIAAWVVTPLLDGWSGGRIAPPIEAVALAGGAALFLPGIGALTWKEAEREIEWGGLMLIIAGLALGLVVFESGSARWLAWILLGELRNVPDLLQPLIIVLAVAALHMMFSSNTVTATIIVPILIALAMDLGLDTWALVAPAAFTSSLAFILVSEGPTTIIPHASGYFSITDMAKAGILMTIAAAGCIAVTQYFVRAVLL
jgi:solute carrier family 13 (sodium-dependent dicarboxylate transporter), member 2/3/5